MEKQKPTSQPSPPDDSTNTEKDALLKSIVQPKCDLCGARMIEWHCRMMCPECGYQRDCSDP